MKHSMLWSTAADARDGQQSNFVAHGLPSFQFNGDDVRRGAVEVNARAPSGRNVQLNVIDNGGVLTTNFTPSEIGDWLISILFDGHHIEGSPFAVRVFDPSRVRVNGLTGGVVGKSFRFNIDTSDAGEGEISIEITYRGRHISAQVIPENNGCYQVSFTPQGPGIYHIRVCLAGTEIKGSPFTLEIIDSSEFSISGMGLQFVEVGHPASFLVHTGRYGDDLGDYLRTTITSPFNKRVPVQIFNRRDGSYQVEYTPHDIGEHIIEVSYYDRLVPGSPFVSQAFDSRKITVSNLDQVAVQGQQVEFDIDVSRAGCGNLEIIVNDGQVPCSVAQLSSNTFHAFFSPVDAVVHYVDMTFNGIRVPGSPWQVDVRRSNEVTATGNGLKLVPIGKVASFDIIGCLATSRITATVLSPSGGNTATNILSQRDGTFHVEYIPLLVGNYKVSVECDGKRITNSPWTAKAYNTGAIKVQRTPATRIVGSPVEFNVDVTEAGEGQLEIMVNRGMVPNTVRMITQGVFQISFIPRDCQPHTIDIKFNGEPLHNGTTVFTIADPGRVTVSGDGLKLAEANRLSTFNVDTKMAGDAELAVRITETENSFREIPVIVRRHAVEGFDVEYTTREPGTYTLEVTYGGLHINGSPFSIKSYDSARVNVQNITQGIVGRESSFIVDVTEAGEGNMEFSITSPNGFNIPNQVTPYLGKTGSFEVTFIPQESGLHSANILFNDEHIPGSPFQFHVKDVANVTVGGSGLMNACCNKVAAFTLNSRQLSQQDLDINITAANGRTLKHRLYNNEGNGFVIEYMPTTIGDHQIDILSHGFPIDGSPFTVNVWDASQVIVSNLRPGYIGKQTTFNVDASRAGAGNLEIVVSSGSENVPNFVNADGRGRFKVTFTPIKPEIHSISVKFNGDSVPGSPFLYELVDSVKAIQLNTSLIRIPLGRPAVVAIDPGKGALQSTQPVCEVISPSDRVLRGKVTAVSEDETIWKAEFVPREIGPHCIQITVGNIEIAGSPFACEVYDVDRIDVNIQPRAVVEKPFDFEVDVSRAGSGDLEVIVKASNHRVSTRVADKGFRVFAIQFLPKTPVRHLAFVLFNDEHVPGCILDLLATLQWLD